MDITGCTGHVSYMPQKDCLFPWRTVLENVTLAVEVAGEKNKMPGIGRKSFFPSLDWRDSPMNIPPVSPGECDNGRRFCGR